MRCHMCQADPTLRDSWGCLRPVDSPIWELDGDLYYSCPILWITEDVAAWYREYEYSKLFGGVPWQQQTQVWVDAFLWYNSAYEGHLAEERARHDSSNSSKAAIRRHMNQGDDDG